jgi:hypothetical protein
VIIGKCESESYSSRTRKITACPKNAAYRVVIKDSREILTEKLVCKFHAVAYKNRIGQPNLAGSVVLSVNPW